MVKGNALWKTMEEKKVRQIKCPIWNM
jgi:hypothetical protein